MDKNTMNAAHNECPLCGADKAAHRLVCVECAPGLYYLEEQDHNREALAQLADPHYGRSSAVPNVIGVAGLLVFCLGLVTAQFWRWPEEMAQAAAPTRMAQAAPSIPAVPSFDPANHSMIPTRVSLPLGLAAPKVVDRASLN